jgi:hypothetical protein
VAVPYADYGILSPLVTIPNPCWHRWAAILHTFALLIFKSANSFSIQPGPGWQKCVTHKFFRFQNSSADVDRLHTISMGAKGTSEIGTFYPTYYTFCLGVGTP